jgi:hypothetical protein
MVIRTNKKIESRFGRIDGWNDNELLPYATMAAENTKMMTKMMKEEVKLHKSKIKTLLTELGEEFTFWTIQRRTKENTPYYVVSVRRVKAPNQKEYLPQEVYMKTPLSEDERDIIQTRYKALNIPHPLKLV